MKIFVRLVFAILCGNVLGYGFFCLAVWVTTLAWQAGPPPTFGALLIRIGLTAMAFATPPVIVAALMARLAGRYSILVGVASTAWGLSARWWWPATVPLLPPESWIAPLTLILLSGLMGGWLGGGNWQPNRDRLTPVPAESSKDSVI